MSPERVIGIVGPTASGKSDLAMQAARRFRGEIVSCDSVQVYRGLDIGSGKPSPEDRAEIPHHLIDIMELDEEMNAAIFAKRAKGAIEEIRARDGLPILTGGTGLYLTALLKGLFEQGPSASEVRNRLDALAERHGSRRMHRLLILRDPEYALRTQPADRVRIVRALEVSFTLGRPFSQVQKERRPLFEGEALVIGLLPPRDELRKRVEARVADMLARGLIDETRRALQKSIGGRETPRSLGAIGYREVVARLTNGSLDDGGDGELQRAIVNSTMQYAKRQMTYFRHQFKVEWFATSSLALERVASWIETPGVG